MNTQRALWLNKDGVLELRKIQIAQREEKRKQAEAAEEKKQRKQAAKRLEANNNANLMEILVHEDVAANQFPLICARSKCRNFLISADSESDT